MRDAEKLIKDYKPLILAVYRKHHPTFHNKEDKDDLMSQIYMLFTKLVHEYDPRRGVDFPFYIKRMLELRTYHYITRILNTKNREVMTEEFTNDKISYSDDTEESLELMNLLEEIESWNDEFTIGKKQKQLFIRLIRDKVTLKELADEENVDISVLHTRMHFLLKKIKQQTELQRKKEQDS